MQARPRLSIITPVLNRAAMLPTALESVAAQGEFALEHLIVDGGSTDGSQEIVDRSQAVFIDAPGTSIYEAINIGLARARGDIVCLLNSDDRLPAGAVAAALDAFDRNAAAELVRGRAEVETQRNGAWALEPAARAVPQPTLRSVLFGPTNINACFFRRNLLERVGAFTPAYRISADREWLIRAILDNVRIIDIDQPLYVYRSHSGSLTIGANKPARIAWVREHIAFAADFLARTDLTHEQRRALQAFYGKETAHLAYLALAAGKPGDALAAIARASRVDALWAPHAFGPLAAIVARRVSSPRARRAA